MKLSCVLDEANERKQKEQSLANFDFLARVASFDFLLHHDGHQRRRARARDN
jgi:hypothetical protein